MTNSWNGVQRERRRATPASLWCLVLSVLVLATSCSRTPPEEALRETVATMQAHIASRDASALHGLID